MAYENKELATIKKPNQIEYITKIIENAVNSICIKSLESTENTSIQPCPPKRVFVELFQNIENSEIGKTGKYESIYRFIFFVFFYIYIRKQ